MFPARSAGFAALGTVLLGIACGGGGDGGGGPSPQLPTLQFNTPSGDGQTDTVGATLAIPYAVKVVDSTGAPVSNVTITWAATQGSVSPPSTTTNASGIASVTRTLGTTAGSQTASAAASGVNGSPKNFTANATAATAADIAKNVSVDTASTARTQVTYTVLAVDGFGNPKSGVVTDWAVTGGQGTLSSSPSTTGADGKASVILTHDGSVGDRTVTATANGISGTPSETFTTAVVTLPNAADVTIGNNIFTPNSVRIALGGSVTWTWVNPVAQGHNVTFGTAGAPGNCGTTNVNGTTCTRTFASVGTFNYSCTIHAGMDGTVAVR
ncbi:MAG: Ig-like domain-containing protein [Gemmatimonadales bacterium]